MGGLGGLLYFHGVLCLLSMHVMLLGDLIGVPSVGFIASCIGSASSSFPLAPALLPSCLVLRSYTTFAMASFWFVVALDQTRLLQGSECQ
jgi:hypothetical protein